MSEKVNPEKLKKGDVILTGLDYLHESWPIKLGNLFHGRGGAIKWTHAAISLGNFDIIESVPDRGVTLENVQTRYVDNKIDILALRC